MAQQFAIPVFDSVLVGASTFYTDPDLDDILGGADQLAIHVVADQGGGTSPSLSVVVQHSSDRRNWVSKTPTAVAISTTAATSAVIFDTSNQNLGYVRIQFSFGSGTNPTAHLVVTVAGRG